MEVTAVWQQMLFGGIGGCACETLHWYNLARKPAGARRYATGTVYWVTTAAMVGLGALMPLLYLSGTGSALLCFHLGIATPLLLQKMVASLPKGIRTQGGALDQPGLADFLRW